MRKTFRAVLAVAGLLLAAGCDSKEIKEEQGKLQLAQEVGDLDRMLVSLKRLAELGEEESQSRIVVVSSDLEAREAMRMALKEHDHERAVINAEKFLSLFLDHKEGIQVLRESGRILWLLGKAQTALSETGAERPPSGHFAVVEPASPAPKELNEWRIARMQEGLRELGHAIEDKEGQYGPSTRKAAHSELSKDELRGGFGSMVRHVANKVDLHRRAQHDLADEAARFDTITKARALVSQARQIDPHFSVSLRLEELLDQAQYLMAVTIAKPIVAVSSEAIKRSIALHDDYVAKMNAASRKRGGSAQQAWAKLSRDAKDFRQAMERLLAPVAVRSGLLSAVEGGSAKRVSERANEIALFAPGAIDRLLFPAGNLADFRRARTEVLDRLKALEGRAHSEIAKDDVATGLMASTAEIKRLEVFRDPATRQTIERNAGLFDS